MSADSPNQFSISRRLLVCHGTNCNTAKSEKLSDALRQELNNARINNVELDTVGCHGFCQVGPSILMKPDNIFYTHVEAEDAAEIVQSHLLEGKPVERLFYRDPITSDAIPNYEQSL